MLACMSGVLLHDPVRAALPDGDITQDGELNIADYLHGLQHVIGSRTLLGDAVTQGDVAPLLNGVPDPNGTLDAADVMVLLRMILYGINFSYPSNQFNIGDSIGEGEAADNDIGVAHRESVWSTGYSGSDIVDSFNERFESAITGDYYENNSSRDTIFNHAFSGAVMSDFAGQALAVAEEAVQVPGGRAGLITMLLGNNDVCAPTNTEMTDPAIFERQFRSGLDVLAGHGATRLAQIHISGIPAIYWLWVAKRTNWICRSLIWPFVPCQNLLGNPNNDCVSPESRNDPDNDYEGETADCQRRKEFHRLTRDNYNKILNDVTNEYRDNGLLPNIRYIDVYDVQFEAIHVNNSDCFHPSFVGHELLANEAWCRTHWHFGGAQCQ